MPTLLTDAPQIPLPPAPPRKRWTREQCAPLEASGLFEGEKLELIDGELISKMGKNRPHVNACTWMHLWLLETFGRQFVNAEAPIDVNPTDNVWNEPEPDLIVLKREFATFESNPQPRDLRLVVEIGDSTLKFDLTVKAALYARAAITEYWVLDVAASACLCTGTRYREPMHQSRFTPKTRSSHRSPTRMPRFAPRRRSSVNSRQSRLYGGRRGMLPLNPGGPLQSNTKVPGIEPLPARMQEFDS
jgi:Uma2 family endonuclease